MTNEELLLEMSKMMDAKIKPVQLLIENDVLPRLQNIESCYTSIYRRYANGIEQLDAMQSDIDVLKTVVTEHSKKIQELQKLA